MIDRERLLKELGEGRLVFVAVCARATTCRSKRCRRRRACLAQAEDVAYGEKSAWDGPTGGCPVMTQEEWRAVKLAIQRNKELLRPYFWAKDEARMAAEAKLPKAERKRLALERLEQARRPPPGRPYTYGESLCFHVLPGGDGVYLAPRFRP